MVTEAALLRAALRDALARVTRMVEAIGDGDLGFAQRAGTDLCADIHAALAGERRVRCDRCGTTFAWPGELQSHVVLVHGEDEDLPW